MEQEQKFVVRCRGIILDKGELLVAAHPGHNYYALPGGKLEFGEDVISCMKRELYLRTSNVRWGIFNKAEFNF